MDRKPLIKLRTWRLNALRLLVGLSVGFQLVVVYKDYIVPWTTQVKVSLNQPAWRRSALFLVGSGFAEYVEFLREQIPENGRVILAPREPIRAVAHVGLMQYFLFPREIHNCGIDEVEECVRRVRGSNTYIVADENFPPRDIAAEFKKFIAFEEETGVFVPR